MLDRILVLFTILMLILLLIGVFKGVSTINKNNEKLKTNCKPTELYIIGNKGHASRVYDCN